MRFPPFSPFSLFSIKMNGFVIFCIGGEECAPFFLRRLVFVVIIPFLAFQLVHVLYIVQNINIDGGNVPVLNSKVVGAAVGIVVGKLISIGIQRHHKTIAVRALLIELVDSQLIRCFDD